MDNKLTFAELQQIYNDIKELETQLERKRQLIQKHLLTSTGRQCCRFCCGMHLPTWSRHPILLLHEVFGTYGVRGR